MEWQPVTIIITAYNEGPALEEKSKKTPSLLTIPQIN